MSRVDIELEFRKVRLENILNQWAYDFAAGRVDADSYPYEVWRERYYEIPSRQKQDSTRYFVTTSAPSA